VDGIEDVRGIRLALRQAVRLGVHVELVDVEADHQPEFEVLPRGLRRRRSRQVSAVVRRLAFVLRHRSSSLFKLVISCTFSGGPPA